MKSPFPPAIELLESRIAPALTIFHPVPDLVPGIGQTGATLDLASAFDAAGSFRPHVILTTNYIDPASPGTPQIIDIELFIDKAPLTVASFLRYVNGLAPSDYDGVFFHRSVPGFVLQGGGFDVSDPGNHIAVDPEVHNEFDPGDAERSNVAGTIAMAKSDLGPNTATSEWFFNLGNNSANLDNQNGGFTVFAKVQQGMNVVNAIAGLTRYNFGGALTDLPLQNYNPDPDNNPATPAPIPTAAQFVTITHAAVVTPPPATASGVSYAITSVVDATTLAPTDLVTGSVAGRSLQLQYKSGASGVAKVTVKASKSGEADVFDDFLVTLRPNLIAATVVNPLPSVLVPGDKAAVSVEVTNSGAALATGNFDVNFYLSRISNSDPLGTLVEPGVDAIVGTLTGQTLSLASGGKTTLTAQVTVPEKLVQIQGESYRVIAEIKPAAGASAELFSDDNVTLNSPDHRIFNAFGTFAGRTNVVMTYADSDNHKVVASIAGPGFGRFDPQGVGDIDKLAIFQTTADSTLTLTADQSTTLNALFIDQALGTAALGDVSIETSFAAPRGLKSVTLGNVGDGVETRPFVIGGFVADVAQKATLTLGRVRDVQFTSDMPIGSFKAVNWIDADAEADMIVAPAIDSLFITGDASVNGAFQADIDLTGPGVLPSFRLAYNDAANQPAILLISGGGYSHFTPIRGGATGPLEILDTTAASTMALASGNPTTVDSIDIANVIASATLSSVTVKGNFEAHGGIKSLTLAGIGDGSTTHTLKIGAFAADSAQKVALTIGHVREVALTSSMPISTLTATDWLDANASGELITAPGIDNVVITGDATHSGAFEPEISISGNRPLQSFKLTYLDPAGQRIALTVIGGGQGEISTGGVLELRGTSALSSFTLVGATPSVKTTVNSISIAAPIGSASLANVTLNGDFTAQGGIKSLTLGNVGDGAASHTISIGAYTNNPAEKVAITLGQVRDVALTSAMPIGAFSAVDWLDSNASNELITAPAIDAVLISGDSMHRGAFQADLTITGTTKLQSFIVTGAVSSAHLQIAGNVGVMRLGALVRSEILVGVTDIPRTLADFGADKHRIDIFKILNAGRAATPLIDSQIVAASFGTISVGKVAPASGISRFGFIADRINNYAVGTKTAVGLFNPMIFDKRTNYAVKIV